jgi:hypothetical protein
VQTETKSSTRQPQTLTTQRPVRRERGKQERGYGKEGRGKARRRGRAAEKSRALQLELENIYNGRM